ncbi:MAG: hypothetical protein NT069_20770, partial [Planctomycetota bacterium]|nr:hypothetical protein [Planctomycetota bacterium]
MSAPANESAALRLPGVTLARFATLVLACTSLCALAAGCQPWLVADSVSKSLPTAKTPAKAGTSDRGSRDDSAIASEPSNKISKARPQSESTAQEFLLNEVATDEPHRVLRSETPNFWDCDLAVIQQIALTNVAIIRDRSQFLSPGNSLLTNPDLVASGFDPAIQEAGGPFNGTGVGQALGDFDPFFITRTVWGHNELLQNNRFLSGGLAPGMELDENSAAFSARVEKTLSTGGVVSVGQEWDYNRNNVPARLYPSVYTGRLYGEFRQPLLAGAGSDFTSVAGPLWRNPTGNTLNQGVVIARLNTEMSMYDFENR